MARSAFTEDEFLYPPTDDLPEAESDLHRKVVTDLVARLEFRYADRDDVYVSGGLRVYCEAWNPYDVCVPDCFVVFGVPKRDRTEYRGWAEGRQPTVVIEVTSNYTQQDDAYGKRRAYLDRWRVQEYFVFDPLEEYLQPSLQGYRLTRGAHRSIRPSGGRLTSEALGVTLSRDGSRLVLRDTATKQELLTSAEQRAAAAEAEVARLKAELAALRGRNR